MLNREKLRSKRYFDEKTIPEDVWAVLKASSALSVGEFRVFQIAYEQWYGEEGEEKAIENHFTSYMFNDIVPIWVRHFCTRVVRLDREDALDPSEFGVRHAAEQEPREHLAHIEDATETAEGDAQDRASAAACAHDVEDSRAHPLLPGRRG